MLCNVKYIKEQYADSFLDSIIVNHQRSFGIDTEEIRENLLFFYKRNEDFVFEYYK